MRCPTCGANGVMIHGRLWECGFCGDCGWLRESQQEAEPEPEETDTEQTLTFSLVFEPDFPETWNQMKTALRTCVPSAAEDLIPGLGTAVLYQISRALVYARRPLPEEKAEKLREILRSVPDLGTVATAEELLSQATCGKILFGAEGRLDEHFCGTFWKRLLEALPSDHFPDELEDVSSGLGDFWQYFLTEELNNDGFHYAREWNALLESKWNQYGITHPDPAQARAMLQKGDPDELDQACRDLLVLEDPDLLAGLSDEDLEDLHWEDMLQEVMEREPAHAVHLWRILLDRAEPCLKTNSRAAEKLLLPLLRREWISCRDERYLDPFLEALKAEAFIRQVFGSAYVDDLQLNLLRLCQVTGQRETAERCLQILRVNPWFRGKDHKLVRYERAAAEESTPIRTEPVRQDEADQQNYFMCQVQILGMKRTYSYRSDDRSICVGDWVSVPFGRYNAPRAGQVQTIGTYTAAEAPYPPEKTKAILGRTAAPVELSGSVEGKQTKSMQEKKSVPEPFCNKSTKPTEKHCSPDRTPDAAHLELGQARTMNHKENLGKIGVTEPERGAPPKKRRLSFEKWRQHMRAAAILLLVIAGTMQWQRWDHRFDQALIELKKENYQTAQAQMQGVPTFVRKEESLRTLAEVGTKLSSTDPEELTSALYAMYGIRPTTEWKQQASGMEEALRERRNMLYYEEGLRLLEQAEPGEACALFEQAEGYAYANQLYRYAYVLSGKDTDYLPLLRDYEAVLKKISESYSGPYAEEIILLKESVNASLKDAEQAEKERIDALKATGLPYVGMPQSEVNSTKKLGKSFRVDDKYHVGKKPDGNYAEIYDGTVYSWYDKAHGRPLFHATCIGGKVISVEKCGGAANWDGDRLLVRTGPQQDETFGGGIGRPEYRDDGAGGGGSLRDDYDSPEDLFEDGGYDSLDEAYDEWEEGW